MLLLQKHKVDVVVGSWKLHDSEINCALQTFADCGFTVWIGDPLNGIKATEEFTIEELPALAC